MAKRQQTLQRHHFTSTCDQVVYENELADKRWEKLQRVANKQGNETSSSSNRRTRSEISSEDEVIEAAKQSWKDAWYTLFDCIKFDDSIGKVFCKTCQSKGGRSVFANAGSINIKISAFQDHVRSQEHKRLT